jgi:hypothetical protein
MLRGFLGVACACAIVACTDDIGLPTGTADLAFEGAGSATAAWSIARVAPSGYAGWSLFFGATGSAATLCNDGSAAVVAQVDLWIDGSASAAPSPLPAGEYIGCGSGAKCAAWSVDGDTVEFGEVELLESDASHLSGSLEGSATTGSDASIAFYGSFDAQICE